jgi:uncharacterized membrane protein
VLVHFPIVLVFVLVVLEFFSNSPDIFKLKKIISGSNLIFSFGSFYTGINDSSLIIEVDKVVSDAISLHFTFGRILFFLSIGIFVFLFFLEKINSKYSSTIYRILVISSVITAIITGYLGGLLVYTHKLV